MASLDFKVRTAIRADEAGVFALLCLVAPEIPLVIDGAERRKVLAALVAECIATGSSLVAEGVDDLCGFQLVRRDPQDPQGTGLELPYGGVRPAFRDHGVFTRLLWTVKAKGRRLRTVVKPDNRSAMAELLQRHGFVYELLGQEKTFIFQP